MPYQVRREGFNKWRRSGASSRVETGKVDLQAEIACAKRSERPCCFENKRSLLCGVGMAPMNG
jgi:hypothetical protein